MVRPAPGDLGDEMSPPTRLMTIWRNFGSVPYAKVFLKDFTEELLRGKDRST